MNIPRPSSRAFGILVLLVAMAWSAAQAQRARDRVPPTAPTGLAVVATTTHSVSLTWGPSTDNSNRFTYLVCCADTTVTVPQTQTSHTLEGLQSGRSYVLRVYAKDAAGNLSGPSNAVTVTLSGSVIAPTRPEVTLLEVGATHARLAWSATDDELPIWFTVFQDGQPVGTWNSTSGTFATLEQQTSYVFTVQARDIDGNLSPLSAPLLVTTAPPDPDDHTPPTMPANLGLENNGMILVQWSPSSDDRTPQSLIRYAVSLNGVLQALVAGVGSAELDPVPGVNTVAVIALDAADNASPPATATIVLP